MAHSEKIKWKFVGGSLSLDFVNTIRGRYSHSEKDNIYFTFKEERLTGFERLVMWAETKKLLTSKEVKYLYSFAERNKTEADRIFKRAFKLREALAGIFVKISLNQQPLLKDIAILSNESLKARKIQQLSYKSTRGFEWSFEQEDDPELIIAKIALSAADLLISDDVGKIRQCPGDDCGWLFLDKTKNHSRQWCDMKDCGNLAKVRRFREREKE